MEKEKELNSGKKNTTNTTKFEVTSGESGKPRVIKISVSHLGLALSGGRNSQCEAGLGRSPGTGEKRDRQAAQLPVHCFGRRLHRRLLGGLATPAREIKAIRPTGQGAWIPDEQPA